MKILLINPLAVKSELRRHGADTHPPLGLLYIAAVLEKEGHKVSVIDNEAECLDEQRLKERISGEKPDAVGITAYTAKYDSVVHAAKMVKAVDRKIPVIIGGPHPSTLPNETLNEIPEADFITVGESEHTIAELVKAIKKGGPYNKIDGIGYRSKGKPVLTKPRELIQNLDELPLPARHLIPDLTKRKSSFRYKRLPFTSMITSRGCPFQCIFCHHSVFGKKYRMHSAERVIKEIEYLIRTYGIKEIHFVDDLFTFDAERTEKICDLIIEKGLDITWSCNGRVNILSRHKHLIPKMKKAGCWYISFGIESGDQETLNFIKKAITLEQIKEVIWAVHRVGIFTKGYFMMAHPIDTKASIRRTINFAKSLPLDAVQFAIATPYPKTELYELAPKYGTFDKTLDYSRYSSHSPDPTFVPKGLTKEYLIRMQKRAYKEYYFRPSYITRQIKFITNLRLLKKYFRVGLSYFNDYYLGKAGSDKEAGV